MPILLLLFLTLACLEEDWRKWDWLGSPELSAALTFSLMAFWISLARYLARWTCHAVAARPDSRDLIAQRYGRLRFYHNIGLYFAYSGALYGLGWGAFVQSLSPSESALFPGGELLVLAPFFAGLIFSWMFFYDAERALHGIGPDGEVFYWSRAAYIGFHIRTNLGLVAIPIFLLIAQLSVGRLLSEFGPGWSGYIAPYFGLGVALAIFFCLPWLLRLILKLEPMPDGPLRTRLIALAQRLKFRCSDILLWNTRRGHGGGIANAMVAGVLPRPRYVLLTDRLIAELSPEEIDAVFGHEVGHIKHHHIPYYASFLIISIGVLYQCAALLLPENDMVKQLAAFPFVAILAAYIFLVFGFLTRRCERQADIYGCRAVSCGQPDCTGHEDGATNKSNGKLCPTGIRTFITALEKVVRLNGIDPDKPGFFQSWQHSTPARRVEFMRRMLDDAALESRFQRKVALVKWGLLTGLSIALVLLAGVSWWLTRQYTG
jgi:Zn-dependent protease with chaperone function